MFVVNEPPSSYSDPWAKSFSDRWRQFARGKRRVAYFYEKPDTSTFRYRVYNMVQTLNAGSAETSAGWFCKSDEHRYRNIVDLADVIVICRYRYDDAINEVITRARQKGIPVYFDVDDLVFDNDFVHLVLQTLGQDLRHPDVWDHWFAYMGRMGATLRLCDGGITTNDYLAARMADFSGLPVRTVPNFMNEHQLEISERIFNEKVQSGFARNDAIHLGYFSGTPTHNHDFSMVGTALASIMSENPNVRLLVVGFLDLTGELRRFKDRIEFFGLHDFVNLQRIMSLVEINLVPLLDNNFTNCKSELKYFEAAAVGTVTVATPIHTYARAIQDGETGFLARSTEWETKIRGAIETLDDYGRMATNARNHALEAFSWQGMLPRIESAIFR